MQILAWAVVLAVHWGILMLTMRIVVGFVNLSLPEFPEWAGKVAVLVAISTALDFIPFVGWIISTLIYWRLLRTWFDADLWAIVYVTLVANAMSIWLSWALIGALS